MEALNRIREQQRKASNKYYKQNYKITETTDPVAKQELEQNIKDRQAYYKQKYQAEKALYKERNRLYREKKKIEKEQQALERLIEERVVEQSIEASVTA